MGRVGAYAVVWRWSNGSELQLGPGWRWTERAARRRLRSWQRRLDRAKPGSPSDLCVVQKRFFSGPAKECPPLTPIHHD